MCLKSLSHLWSHNLKRLLTWKPCCSLGSRPSKDSQSARRSNLRLCRILVAFKLKKKPPGSLHTVWLMIRKIIWLVNIKKRIIRRSNQRKCLPKSKSQQKLKSRSTTSRMMRRAMLNLRPLGILIWGSSMLANGTAQWRSSPAGTMPSFKSTKSSSMCSQTQTI